MYVILGARGQGSIALLLFAVVEASAATQTIYVRGLLGPIVDRRAFSSPTSLALRGGRPLGPTALSLGGKVFEITANGMHEVKVDAATGRLRNVVDPRTADAVIADVARNLRSMSPSDQFLGNKVLQARALGLELLPSFANVAVRAFSGAKGRDSGCARTGGDTQHGGGKCLPTDPRTKLAIGGRDEAVTNPIGPNGKLLPSACRDLATSLCGANDPSEIERKAFGEAKALVQGYLAKSGTSFGNFSTAMANLLRDPARFGGDLVRFTNFVSASLPEFDELKRTGKQRLTQAVSEGPFSPAMKQQMTEKFAKLTITMTPPLTLEGIRAYARQCGPDAMEDGAFALTGTDTVVICPGMVMRARASGKSLVHSLLHVLGHECFHHCGGDLGSPARAEFAQMGSCLQRRFSSMDVNAQLGEISADVMGFRMTGEEIASMSTAQAYDVLRTQAAPLCGTNGDAEHPSGRFRLNVLLGETPSVLRVLGCEMPPEACAL